MYDEEKTQEEINREEYRKSRKKPENIGSRKSGFLTLVLSIMPGLGHMYLGYMNKGIMIMSVFLFISFFIGWLGLPLLGFIIPVIWFYSVFDAQNLNKYPVEDDIDFSKIMPDLKNKVNSNWIGWLLIIFGVLIIGQKLLYPMIQVYLDYRIINIIQTLIVSSIFIYGGIKLIEINKGKDDENNLDEDVIDEEGEM